MVVAAIGNNLIYHVFGILGIMHRDASYANVGNVGRNLVIAILVFLAALVVVKEAEIVVTYSAPCLDQRCRCLICDKVVGIAFDLSVVVVSVAKHQ